MELAINTDNISTLKKILISNYDQDLLNQNIVNAVQRGVDNDEIDFDLKPSEYVLFDFSALSSVLCENYLQTRSPALLKQASDLASGSKNLTQKAVIDYCYAKAVTVLRKLGYHVKFSFGDTITFTKDVNKFTKYFDKRFFS